MNAILIEHSIKVPDIIMVVATVLVFECPRSPSKHSMPVSFWSRVILYRVTIELRMSPLLVASVILNTPNEYGRLLENRLYVATCPTGLYHTKSPLVYVVQLMMMSS